MALDMQLLQCLSNGHFCSGEYLANTLGVSRTTVWKEIQKLRQQYSVEVQSVKGRGYRLSQPLELLESEKILANISAQSRTQIAGMDILTVVDSTNRYLMAAASQGAPGGQLVLAEQQTEGRGRLGRTWVSPFGCNLYCSLLWRFNLAATGLSGLGIVIAVALSRAMSVYAEGLKIKWPNDVLWQNKKLAGILLEMQGEANGPGAVVIGIGVNVRMSDVTGRGIDQPWTDLYTSGGKSISRNELAANIIEQVILAIQMFEKHGLSEFIDSWSERDLLNGQPVEINQSSGKISGIARGIDDTGALRVESEGIVKSYMAGEASLKKHN